MKSARLLLVFILSGCASFPTVKTEDRTLSCNGTSPTRGPEKMYVVWQVKSPKGLHVDTGAKIVRAVDDTARAFASEVAFLIAGQGVAGYDENSEKFNELFVDSIRSLPKMQSMYPDYVVRHAGYWRGRRGGDDPKTKIVLVSVDPVVFVACASGYCDDLVDPITKSKVSEWLDFIDGHGDDSEYRLAMIEKLNKLRTGWIRDYTGPFSSTRYISVPRVDRLKICTSIYGSETKALKSNCMFDEQQIMRESASEQYGKHAVGPGAATEMVGSAWYGMLLGLNTSYSEIQQNSWKTIEVKVDPSWMCRYSRSRSELETQ